MKRRSLRHSYSLPNLTLSSYVSGDGRYAGKGMPSDPNPFKCRIQANMEPVFAANKRGIVSRTNRCTSTYQHRDWIKGSYSYSIDTKTGDIAYASDTKAALGMLVGSRAFARDMGRLIRAAYLGTPCKLPNFQPLRPWKSERNA